MALRLNKKSLSLFGLTSSIFSLFVSCSCQEEPQASPTPPTTQKVELKAKPKVKITKDTCPHIDYGDPKNFVDSIKKRKEISYVNSKPTDPYAYYWDGTTEVSGLANVTSLPMMRVKGHCQPLLKEGTQIINGKVETLVEVISPTILAYRFEGVEKVIVFTDEGEFVFDSDDFDLQKSFEIKAPKNPSDPAVFGISENPRSINSQFFLDTLKKARKISFGVRDAYWSDYSGAKTKYRLSPKDILFSFLRTFYLTPSDRHKNGGSKELDDAWYSKTKSIRFLPTTNYHNDYLFDVFRINYRAWLRFEEDFDQKPLETIEVEGTSTPVFSVYLNEGAPLGTMYNFFLIFGDSAVLALAPSEYLEEQHTLRDDPNEGSGLVHRIGYYYYGQREEDMLFAAPFMPFEHSVEGAQETKKMRKNPNYWDKKWVEDPNNIREIITINLQRDGEAISQSAYANFVQGITTSLDFASLNPEVSKKIKGGEDPNLPLDLIAIIKTQVFGTIPWQGSFSAAPKSSIDESGVIDTSLYTFNDAYSKFMYGASLEELAKGEVKTLKSFFGEDQIAFRSLLVGGVNWHRAVLDYTSGNFMYSLTLAAPDGKIYGSDHDDAEIQTISQAYSLANSPFIVWEGRRDLTIPIEENLKGAASHLRSESYMGGGPKIYAQLQEKMTTLLDRVFAKHNFSQDTTLDVPLYWYVLGTRDTWKQTWEATLEALNKLDKKGRLKFSWKPLIDQREWNAHYLHKVRRHGQWNYDFSGNASYLDGIFFSNFYIAFLKELVAKEESDPNNPFPMLTRLAKLLERGIKEGKYRFKIPFEDWMDLKNKDSWDKHTLFKSTQEDFPNSKAQFTSFFVDTQKEFTNEEHVKLNVEIAVLMGPKFDYRAHVPIPNKAIKFLRHKGMINPRTSYYYLDTTYVPLQEEEETKKTN